MANSVRYFVDELAPNTGNLIHYRGNPDLLGPVDSV
jgi:hypothetical protein